MPVSIRDGVQTQYTVQGSGYPLVLLHGFTGSGASWESLAAELAQHYTVILPDIIGHGQSDSPADVRRYQIEQAAADIVALIDAPFALAGYSMGGRLALTIAANYPERVSALLLESASPGLRTEAERTARQASDDALAAKIEVNGLAWFVDYWGSLSLWDHQPQAVRDKLRESRLHNNPLGLANSLRGMGTGVMPPLWDKLPQLTMRITLLAGALDSKFAQINREMAQLMPHADLHIIPAAGHTVHLEQPRRWLDAVISRSRK